MTDATGTHDSTAITTPARVLTVTDDHCIAIWRRFLVVVWRKDTTSPAVADFRAALTRLASETHEVALLTVVEPNAPPPPSDVRDALAAVLAEFGKLIKFSAVAFEGTGFRAAMVRGVVTGLTLLARMPYPHKVFAGVPEAARWLIPNVHRLGWHESMEELTTAVAELRHRVAAA
jgi:hypothetical protein